MGGSAVKFKFDKSLLLCGDKDFYTPRTGSFLPYIEKCRCGVGYLFSEDYDWVSCREEFDEEFPHDGIFLFYSGDNSENVARFINQVENRLNLKSRTKIQGFKTDKDLLLVSLSKWWQASVARRSLFTILLRCGLAYKGNFEKALSSQGYIKATREAVDLFFKGYTNCTHKDMGGFYGWVEVFDKNSETVSDSDEFCDFIDKLDQNRKISERERSKAIENFKKEFFPTYLRKM